ncbi:uncharacterized protein BO72DRAFT_247249 [Aspergillus fijiensis CBS 313.89]|uniref:Uncharacterized protein n=1 Tax=Aspergillus fijiensis CBS 313.89 TaxID=1448319 RepID=A0A8G1RIY1_9EURO|nr:uncharacterized protein BO72DRAFT_247249 [Aspergillus fijiensis CBS 313.89]RAK73257.1 hypothetical protein BO72DRAFT_247249 [Aspergillus fijiensis CBS 313.89]
MLSQLANKPMCLTSSGSLWPQVQATMGMWLRRRRDKGCCARGMEGCRRVGEACLVRASMPAPTGAGVAVEVCNKSREAVSWFGRRDWYKPGEVERKPTSAPSDIRPCCTCLRFAYGHSVFLHSRTKCIIENKSMCPNFQARPSCLNNH